MHVVMQYTDSEGLPVGRLNLWRRLSIALGASKGKPIFFFSFGVQNTQFNLTLNRSGTSSQFGSSFGSHKL